MSEELTRWEDETLPEMTEREADQEIEEMKQQFTKPVIRLYLFRERKGYKAKGFSDFGDFCQEVFGIHAVTGYRWCDRVEITCQLQGVNKRDLLHNATFSQGMIPITTSMELKKLPSPELRRKAWEEWAGINEANDNSPMAVTSKRIWMQRIVKRIAAENAPKPQEPTQQELDAAKVAELEAIEAKRQAEAAANEERLRQQEREAQREQEAHRRQTADSTIPTEEQIPAFESESFTDDFPETEEEARAFVGGAAVESDIPKVPIHTAHACQRDDGLRSLMADVMIGGCLVAIRIPFALLPGNMQPR